MTAATIDAMPLAGVKEGTARRRLTVPIGGRGWGWSLFVRYTLIFSIGHFLNAIPFTLRLSSLHYQLGELGHNLVARLHLLELSPERWSPSGALAAQMYAGEFLMPLILALVWMLIDRKRKHEVVLNETARLFARYGLAQIMASYGLEKVFGAQGSWAYEPEHMLASYGEQGGGTTLMTWLGHSGVYEQFAGWVETICTFLLPFRRTTTLGALIGLAALVNVFIVNAGHWGLDISLVPVAFSPLAIFLLAPHARRFAQFFRNRDAEPTPVAYLTPPAWWWYGGMAVKPIVIGWMLYQSNHLYFAVASARQSALGGLYRVDSMTRNGRSEPLSYEYPARWRDVTIGRQGENISVRTVNETRLTFMVKGAGGMSSPEQVTRTSLPEGELELSGRTERRIERKDTADYTTPAGSLHFAHPTPDLVTLKGVVSGDTIDLRLRRIHLDSLPFHRYRWYPKEWRRRFGEWVRSHGGVYPY